MKCSYVYLSVLKTEYVIIFSFFFCIMSAFTFDALLLIILLSFYFSKPMNEGAFTGCGVSFLVKQSEVILLPP